MRRKTSTKLPQLWTDRKIEAAFLLACLGATEEQMAVAMEVSTPTIKYWKKRHPEFKKAVDDGTLGVISKVNQAFIQRCTGYDYDEEICTYDRSAHTWIKTTKKTHVSPDPWACARLLELKARNYNWSVTQNVNLTQTNTNININLSELTTEQLAVLENISLKQLPYNAGNNDI
jgi:hypothetical protein